MPTVQLTDEKNPAFKRKHTDFRLYLQDELLKRCRNNSSYSLRSFARSIQINPSSLSRILRGQRAISETIKEKLGCRLGLSPVELTQFKTTPVKRDSNYTSVSNSTMDFNQLSLDVFSVISDWYHYAILELTYLHHFKSDPKWIARTLGITVSEVHVAKERLTRLGILKITKKGTWVNHSGNHTNISEDMKASAYRKLQKQVLEMAIKALEEVPIEQRDQSSLTVAIHTKRLPAAIERITQFRREFNSFLEQDSKRDHVYQLGISFYPVTKLNGKGAKNE